MRQFAIDVLEFPLTADCFRGREQELRTMSKIVLLYERQYTAIESLRKRRQGKTKDRLRRERELVGRSPRSRPAPARGRKGE